MNCLDCSQLKVTKRRFQKVLSTQFSSSGTFFGPHFYYVRYWTYLTAFKWFCFFLKNQALKWAGRMLRVALRQISTNCTWMGWLDRNRSSLRTVTASATSSKATALHSTPAHLPLAREWPTSSSAMDKFCPEDLHTITMIPNTLSSFFWEMNQNQNPSLIHILTVVCTRLFLYFTNEKVHNVTLLCLLGQKNLSVQYTVNHFLIIMFEVNGHS
jgi:hypothetical protein